MNDSRSNVNINDYFQKFLEFEQQENLYSLTIDRISAWDIVRYSVFHYLYDRAFQTDALSDNGGNVCKKMMRKFVSFFYAVLSIIRVEIKLREKNGLFFSSSRKKSNNHYIDSVNYDVKSMSGNNYVDLEFNVLTKRIDSIFYHKRFFNHLNRTDKHINSEVVNQIASIISKVYDCSPNIISDILYKELTQFYKDYDYYSYILKRVKPKNVFLTQDGIQKGLIYACKKQDVPIHEFQHGIINRVHLAYSYNPEIDYSSVKTLPDSLLTFSKYWDRFFYMPNTKIVPIGNSFYNYKRVENFAQNKNCILIISSILHQELFDDFLKNENQDRLKIILKLHPGQRPDYENIKTRYMGDENIEVIYDEYSMEELLEMASEMVVIRSTVTYEALQLGIPVYILKQRDYLGHSDLFGIKGVSLIENMSELLEKRSEKIEVEEIVFFESFNPQMISNLKLIR